MAEVLKASAISNALMHQNFSPALLTLTTLLFVALIKEVVLSCQAMLVSSEERPFDGSCQDTRGSRPCRWRLMFL